MTTSRLGSSGHFDVDFLLLGFGDSSGLFLPAGVVSEVVAAFSPSTHPNTLTCEGSMRSGVADTGRQKPSSSALFPS